MAIISIQSYLLIALVLFCLGLYTSVAKKNIIGIFMGIELILNSSALNFAAFSSITASNPEGQLFSVFVIVIAAAEAAIALALLLSVYRRFNDIDADKLNEMKG